jgi:RNA polymerase sigma-70 factor (ECF subfamily)
MEQMIETTQIKEWIDRTLQGDQTGRENLAKFAAEKLRNYVFRMTLREDVTEDVVQETVLEMMKILEKLKNTERFIPWLYGIATNKLRTHRRTEQKHHKHKEELAGRLSRDNEEPTGLEDLIGQELRQVIRRAMLGIHERHRAVLSMRCYDDMSYAEIAQVLGVSEFAAQMLFLRAKRSLAKELGRFGLGKGAILTVLILFGKMTATTEAAAVRMAVSSASLKVGFLASLAGMVASKSAFLPVTAGGTVATSLVALNPIVSNDHSSSQDVTPDIQMSAPLEGSNQAHEGDVSRWYYYPEGLNGPMMLRVVQLGATNGDCLALQNAVANYHYNGSNIVTIDNYRSYRRGLGVTVLPGDSEQLYQFIASQSKGSAVPRPAGIHFTTQQRGLLIIEDSTGGDRRAQVEQHLNLLEEEYFQYHWGTQIRVVDQRDEMHQRGWTVMEISGQFDGQPISGKGQIPFVYAACKVHRPWLEIRIGPERLIDSIHGSEWIASDGSVHGYPANRFFEGLIRPWMGLHTIDIIRRDAAIRGIAFETQRLAEDKVAIILHQGEIRIEYRISLDHDLIETITLHHGPQSGQIHFDYHQTLPPNLSAWSEPQLLETDRRYDTAETLWIMDLMGK